MSDPTTKLAIDMDFREFNAWATGTILLGIGEGKPLKDLVWLITNQQTKNKVFGGEKEQK